MERVKRETIEKLVGMDYYGVNQSGIGGVYKFRYKDFVVKEITREGRILEIKEDISKPTFNPNHKYTRFNVTKVERDTIEVAKIIAKTLNVPLNHVTYSGLKDHRAITVQEMSVKGDAIDKLKEFKKRNIFVRAFRSSKFKLTLGDNWGNNFSIIVRNIEDDGKIEKRLALIKSDLENYGVPNYYGLQRFGIYRPNSHIIGKYIILKQYKEAVEEFLMRIFPVETYEKIETRKTIEEIVEYSKSFDQIPRQFDYEKSMIEYLIESDYDYKGSLLKLPIDLLSLLISAYQSYLFNKAISERMRMGYSVYNPVVGDLIGLLDEEMGHLTHVKYLYDKKLKKHLDKAIKLKRATIISPIVGYDTDLNPKFLMAKIYEKIMQEEGISKEIFDVSDFVDLDYHGTYRSISLKPRGFVVRFVEDDELNPGKKKVRIEFDLEKGTYATIIIRELLKQ